MTVSIPTSFWIRIAEGSTPMRLWARGPSGTFTASTPAALSARHCSSIGVGSTPLGGTISTLVTSSPRASFEHAGGTHRAVHPDGVRAPRRQLLCERLGAGAVVREPVVADCHLRDHGQIRYAPHGAQRLVDLVHV